MKKKTKKDQSANTSLKPIQKTKNNNSNDQKNQPKECEFRQVYGE